MKIHEEDPAPGRNGDRADTTVHEGENRSQSSGPEPTEEERSGLEVARQLTRAGVSIFSARPARRPDGTWDPHGGHDGTGYWLPKGWQKTTPDESVIDAWRPGDALGLVCGGPLDAIDVDPRHDGDASHAALAGAGMLPTIIGRQRTPSGGHHDLVNHLGARSLDDTMPGLDVKAGHEGMGIGFVFLAPTRKAAKGADGKPTGDVGTYGWDIEPNVDEIDPADDSGAALAGIIADKRGAAPGGPHEPVPDYDGPVFPEMAADEQRRLSAWLDAKRKGRRADISTAVDWPEGHRPGDAGWQKLTADEAFHWRMLSLMPWSPVTEAEAHEVYLETIPQEFRDAERVDVAETWRKQSALALAKRSTHALRFPDHPDAATKQLDSGGSDGSGCSGGSNGGVVSDPNSGGSDGSGCSGGSNGGVVTHRGVELPLDVVEDGERLFDEVREWLARHVHVNDEHDHDVLTVWAVHTHLSESLLTSPRLQVDSAVPESGKTTVLEHLQRLTFNAVQASSISSPALLARLVEHEPRTLLLDEVDRTLDPRKEGVGELLALLNSGYKVGATRPTLVPVKGGGWQPQELPTFAPVAMAGNQPALPDDTRSRIIRVVLLPDHLGVIEESDWEMKEQEASELGARLARWAIHAREGVRPRPEMPRGCTSRLREKWQPLARVAQAAGPRWLATILECAAEDVARVQQDREAGLAVERPSLLVLRHVLQDWPAFSPFWKTTDMVEALIREHPEVWGESSDYGKDLTVQRLGRMFVSGYNVRSIVENPADKNSPRGYRRSQFERAARALNSRPKVELSPPEVQASPHGTAGTSGTPGTAGSDIAMSGAPCPSCGGPLEALRAEAGLDCVTCYQRTRATA